MTDNEYTKRLENIIKQMFQPYIVLNFKSYFFLYIDDLKEMI